MRIFSDLNLNGPSSARVQPKVGEWGPLRVPSTGAKKRMRVWVTLAFLVAVGVIAFLMRHYFQAFQQG